MIIPGQLLTGLPFGVLEMYEKGKQPKLIPPLIVLFFLLSFMCLFFRLLLYI